MRIAFFVQYSDLNGTYFRWHNLAKALQLEGHEVDVYAGDHNWKTSVREETRDGIQYYIIPAFQTARIFYSPNDPFSALRRLRKLPGKTYDVYHLFQPFLQAYLPWKSLIRKNKRAIFLYDWDDLWTDGLFKKANNLRQRYLLFMTKYLEKKIPMRSDGVTVCSQFLADRVYDGVFVKKIYNGFWPAALPEKKAMREKWKLEIDIFYMGYVGKTAGELNWIIEGLQYLNQQGLAVKLVICGPPRIYMEQNGLLNDRNIIYLGEVKPAEAREIAAAVDLGMIPLEDNLFNQSRFPIKFFDFLTVNTPVYLSGVGEIALIGKQIQAVFSGAVEKDEWIHGLKNVVQTLWTETYTVNIEGLTQQFSWPAIARELVNFYEHMQQIKRK